ncbi:hypothetical protein ACHWQZ_G016665 [Mnemiopsis leidyi]
MSRRSLLSYPNVANGLETLSKSTSITTSNLLPESWHQSNSRANHAANSPLLPSSSCDLRNKLNKRHKLQSSYDELDGVELGDATCITSVPPVDQNGVQWRKRFTRWGPESLEELPLGGNISSGRGVKTRDEDYYSPTSVCSSDEENQVGPSVPPRPYLLPTPGPCKPTLSYNQRRSGGLLPSPALLDTSTSPLPPPPPPPLPRPPPRPTTSSRPATSAVKVPIVMLSRCNSENFQNNEVSRFTVSIPGEKIHERPRYHASDKTSEIGNSHLLKRKLDNCVSPSIHIQETSKTQSAFNQFNVPHNFTEYLSSNPGYKSQSALPHHHDIPIQKYNTEYSELQGQYLQPGVPPGIQQYSTDATPQYSYPFPFRPRLSCQREEGPALAGPSHYQSQFNPVQQTQPVTPRQLKLNVESSTNYIDEIQQKLSTEMFDEIISKTLDPAVLVRCIKALGEIKEVLPLPGHGMMSVTDKKTVFMAMNDVLRRLHRNYEEQHQYKNTTIVNYRKQLPPCGMYRSKPEFVTTKVLEILSFLTNSKDISKLDEVDLTYNEHLESVPEGLNWVYSLKESDLYVNPDSIQESEPAQSSATVSDKNKEQVEELEGLIEPDIDLVFDDSLAL